MNKKIFTLITFFSPFLTMSCGATQEEWSIVIKGNCDFSTLFQTIRYHVKGCYYEDVKCTYDENYLSFGRDGDGDYFTVYHLPDYQLTSEIIFTHKNETISVPITIEATNSDIQAYEYARSITFPIIVNNDVGTCWVVNKTDDDTNNFKYWFATCLHVTNDVQNPTRIKFCVTNDKCHTYSIDSWYRGYHFIDVDSSYVDFQPIKILEEIGNKKYTDDLRIFSIDFTDYLNTNQDEDRDFLLGRLNSYNVIYQAKNGHIQNFIDGYVNISSSTPAYICGYPVYNRNYSTFTFRKLTSNYTIQTNEDYKIIDNNEYYQGVDNYYFDAYLGSFLGGGASGSPMFDKDYNICGIYWGIAGSDIFQHPLVDTLKINGRYNFMENYE